jgi:hypothetical protein
MANKNKPMPEHVKSLLKSRKRNLGAAVGKDPAEKIDNDAVDAIAEAMKAKLGQKRLEGRGGWNDPEQCSSDQLAKMLINHVTKGDVIDIANFCAMLYNRDPFGSALRRAGLAFQEEMAKQRDTAITQQHKAEDVLRGAQEEAQQLRSDLARAMGYIDRILDQENVPQPISVGDVHGYTDVTARGPKVRNC